MSLAQRYRTLVMVPHEIALGFVVVDCSCQIHVAVWLLCCMSLTDLFTQTPQILQALLMYVVHLRQLAM